MWWSRAQATAALCLALVAGLAGCGFTPVHAPGAAGASLVGQVSLPAPQDRPTQLYQQRIAERLGHGGATYRLDTTVSSDELGLGTTSDGRTTLYQLTGEAEFELVDQSSGAVLVQGRTDAFTSYSASGSTVATLTAQRDATDRLMVILADQTIDLLLVRLTAAEAR